MARQAGPPKNELSRRDLLTFWKRRTQPEAEPPPATPIAAAPQAPAIAATPPAPLENLSPLRPPGALAEPDFLDTCRRCGRCVEACPATAIRPEPDGTPAIEARRSPCVVCDELACTHACPSGALRPLADRLQIRMGTAEVVRSWCIAWRGAPCRACVDLCPIPGALKLVRGERVYVPEVDAAVCIGCGICERYCPTKPAAIRVVPARAED
jgi:MauM/NapG family ferredoxin protein